MRRLLCIQLGLIALGLSCCDASGERSPANELPTDVPSYPDCVYDERPAEPAEVATASETSAIALREVVDGVYSGTAVWHGGLETSGVEATLTLFTPA